MLVRDIPKTFIPGKKLVGRKIKKFQKSWPLVSPPLPRRKFFFFANFFGEPPGYAWAPHKKSEWDTGNFGQEKFLKLDRRPVLEIFVFPPTQAADGPRTARVKFYLGYYNSYEDDSNGNRIVIQIQNIVLLSKILIACCPLPPRSRFPFGNVNKTTAWRERAACYKNFR